MTDYATAFALSLKRIREAASLSKAELGRCAGISGAAVSRMESGYSKPSLVTLCRLADGLRCRLDELCGRKQE